MGVVRQELGEISARMEIIDKKKKKVEGAGGKRMHREGIGKCLGEGRGQMKNSILTQMS